MIDLTDIHTIRRILGENRIKPSKRLGQNFLVASRPLTKLIESAQIKTDDIVVEIGPGLGTLTQELAKRAKLVLAVEKDYQMVEWLRRYLKSKKNVKIIHDDILKFPISNFSIRAVGSTSQRGQFPNKSQIPNVENSKLEKVIPRLEPALSAVERVRNDNNTKKFTPLRNEVSSAGLKKPCLPAGRLRSYGSYKVVANLPYQITSPVIRKFLTSENPPIVMILMVQKEVAQRICAQPGSSKRGFLTVMVEFYGEAEIVDYVERSCFWPSPEVDSAIIKIALKQNSIKTKRCHREKVIRRGDPITNRDCFAVARNDEIDPESFFRLVKAGFSQKRRQIHHPLRANLHISKDKIFAILKKAEIEPTKRAEELKLEEWIGLYKIISNS